jgi:hypothetical protein
MYDIIMVCGAIYSILQIMGEQKEQELYALECMSLNKSKETTGHIWADRIVYCGDVSG